MRRLVLVLAMSTAALVPALAQAKKKGGAAHGGGAHAAHGVAPSARAMSELAGKFKWNMTPEECMKVISDQLHEKYAELIKKEQDVYKQDQLRKEERDETEKVKASLVKFDGQKTGWDSSLIDKEFGQRNNESMLVLWEKDQKRFLFFWNEHLYKQYIAFNAEHPVFAGKSFDDFAKLIQNRYGQAEMKMAALRTKDDVTLDHLEWPPAGDFTLWAIDQSSFYGNFCLKLLQTSKVAQVDKSREEHSPKAGNHNAVIDAITAPEQVAGDPNADVVDSIVGRRSQRTNQGNAVKSEEPAASGTGSASKKKKTGKAADPLDGMNL